MSGPVVEVCLDSLASALSASKAAGRPTRWRIELCGNLLEGGGLTPSLGLLRAVKAHLPDIDIMVMIRPRSGSFVYTDFELEVMLQDIRAFREEGVKGFVFGILTPDGRVDIPTCRSLVAAVDGPFDITFHRAFDVTPNWKEALDDIASIGGITRILTSGHGRNVPAGLDELKELMEWSTSTASGITILPGSGVNAGNVRDIKTALPLLTEIHLSASGIKTAPAENGLIQRGAELGFGSGDEWVLSEERLRAFFNIVHIDQPGSTVEEQTIL